MWYSLSVRLRCVDCGHFDSAVKGKFVNVASGEQFVCKRCSEKYNCISG